MNFSYWYGCICIAASSRNRIRMRLYRQTICITTSSNEESSYTGIIHLPANILIKVYKEICLNNKPKRYCRLDQVESFYQYCLRPKMTELERLIWRDQKNVQRDKYLFINQKPIILFISNKFQEQVSTLAFGF